MELLANLVEDTLALSLKQAQEQFPPTPIVGILAGDEFLASAVQLDSDLGDMPAITALGILLKEKLPELCGDKLIQGLCLSLARGEDELVLIAALDEGTISCGTITLEGDDERLVVANQSPSRDRELLSLARPLRHALGLRGAPSAFNVLRDQAISEAERRLAKDGRVLPFIASEKGIADLPERFNRHQELNDLDLEEVLLEQEVLAGSNLFSLVSSDKYGDSELVVILTVSTLGDNEQALCPIIREDKRVYLGGAQLDFEHIPLNGGAEELRRVLLKCEGRPGDRPSVS